MKKFFLTDIIETISLLGILISVLMLIGTAGAIDCNTVTAADGFKCGAIWLGILIASVICIVRLEGDDDEYRRL